jgi:hypothetical protein
LVTKNTKAARNPKAEIIEENITSKENIPENLIVTKPEIKKKRIIKNAAPVDSDHIDIN